MNYIENNKEKNKKGNGNMPLVSVVIPVYNVEMYLAQCIESILKQSYFNIEVVLVDDCSEDNSYKICARYKKKDRRIKLIKNEKRSGVSKTRNCGISNSTGRFICFIDADDYLDFDFVKKLVQQIISVNVPVVFSCHKYLQDGKMIKRPLRIDKGLYTVNSTSHILIDDGTLTGILFGSVCGSIYDLDYLKSHKILFDIRLKKNEDGVFNLDLLSCCEKYYVSDYAGYFYRQWKSQIKYNLFKPDKELEKATKEILNKYVTFDSFELQIQRRYVFVCFQNAIKVGQCEGSLRENTRLLKRYLNKKSFSKYYNALNFKKIRFFKHFLSHLLYKNQIMLFVLLMKYVYPIMKRFR